MNSFGPSQISVVVLLSSRTRILSSPKGNCQVDARVTMVSSSAFFRRLVSSSSRNSFSLGSLRNATPHDLSEKGSDASLDNRAFGLPSCLGSSARGAPCSQSHQSLCRKVTCNVLGFTKSHERRVFNPFSSQYCWVYRCRLGPRAICSGVMEIRR